MAVKRALVANRGEIAVRVIRAARALGIAAHPDFEANTIHTRWLEHTYLAEFEMNEGETVDGSH